MKQTESLLKNGYVTSRGKAYVGGTTKSSGTAYRNAIGTSDLENIKFQDVAKTVISTVDQAANNIVASTLKAVGKKVASSSAKMSGTAYPTAITSSSTDSGSGSDATDKFEETFDWIEVRLEEINEELDLMSAKLENAVGYAKKNNIIDDMLGVNTSKIKDLESGIAKYSEHASKLLSKIPSKYREMAQDGSIAITEFAGEADEETVDAINNYREWAEKVADLKQQLEEVNTEMRELAKQKFDNIVEAFDAITDINDHKQTKLDDAISLMEDQGNVASTAYYEALAKHEKEQLTHLQDERQQLINTLNKNVEDGLIPVESPEWYEMVGQIYEVDHAIDECTASLEDYQNKINDIYWDNFDELINRFDYIRNETEGLIDVLSHDDLITEPNKRMYKGGTEEYWTETDVDFTNEGIATLGLYAQQMELSEYESKKYAEAIDDLTAGYEQGLYSESEYYEKLDELTDKQYDSIDSYYEARDAIVDLNKERIESIKDGIDKEIDAYKELIDAKKEALDTERDLYDFQKNVTEQQKDIAAIQRKLAALANDNSASAVAQKKKLQAELAEANSKLEETYYDRSIQNQKDALDQEYEDFKEEKDAEKEVWDEYLDDIETIIAESLGLIQANASDVYNTLGEKATEYDLTVSEAVTTPWKDGMLAVSEYSEKFDTASSSTINQLEIIANKWQEVIDKMLNAAEIEIAAQEAENKSYTAATKKEPAKTQTTTTSKPQTTTKAAPTVDSTVKVKTSATHFSSNSGNLKMASFVPGGSYTVYETDGDQILIGRNGVYTGWIKKSDLQGYAKGTTGVKAGGLFRIDENNLEELVMHAGPDGRVQYLSKGTSVIPHDITENLMELGQLDPSEVLNRSRAAITTPHVTNNEINISMDIAEVVHIDKVTNDTLPNLTKAIEKQMDSYIGKLNNSLKRFTR